MSIPEKLEGLAEGVLDSLKTTEVQLPLFGIVWACSAAWFPAFIPGSVDLTVLTSFLPPDLGAMLPKAITPGWLIVCLPLIVMAKALTPGRLPFVSTSKPADSPKEEA